MSDKLKNFQKTQVRHWFDFPSEYTDTTINFYGTDSEELFDKNNALDWNVSGGEQPTSHITQTNKYTKDSIKYTFNHAGMRGPELTNFTSIKRCPTNRILHIGASVTFGFGVNLGETYPHLLNEELNGCYWNVSPVNTVFQIIDTVEDLIEQVKPTTLIVSPPRYVQDFDYLNKVFRNTIQDKELSHMFLETKMTSKKSIQDAFLRYLNLIAKVYSVKIILINHGYKYWRDYKFNEKNNLIEYVTLDEKETYIDLSRDCRHPGVNSHKQIVKHLLKLL